MPILKKKINCKILPIFWAFNSAFQTNAQNLVQNPSFENISSCPNSIAQVAKAHYWSDPILSTFYVKQMGCKTVLEKYVHVYLSNVSTHKLLINIYFDEHNKKVIYP